MRLLTSVVYHSLSSYCWMGLQRENNLQCMLQLILFEHQDFCCTPRIFLGRLCSGQVGKAPYWLWICCGRVTKGPLPCLVHHYCLFLIVDLPLCIPHPSTPTLSVLWNFCTPFYWLSSPVPSLPKGSLLHKGGNGTSCSMALCVALFRGRKIQSISGEKGKMVWW